MAPSVTFAEQTSVKIASFLRMQGLTPADAIGKENLSGDDETCVGVLKGAQNQLALAFLRPKHRKSFIGVIWINNQRLGATPDRLVFDVYGRLNVAFALDLGNMLSKYLDLDITVRLVSEEEKEEAFSGDRHD